MAKFIQVTLIEAYHLEDDPLRMKLLNTQFIREIGIDADYRTVITMIDGERKFVDEGYSALSETLDAIRV